MWNALKELLSSKKALATIVAILVWAIGKAGLDVSPDTLYPIVVLLAGFVVGQAIADFGKAKAKIDGETAKALAQTAFPKDPP
jgi:hypothetical protein